MQGLSIMNHELVTQPRQLPLWKNSVPSVSLCEKFQQTLDERFLIWSNLKRAGWGSAGSDLTRARGAAEAFAESASFCELVDAMTYLMAPASRSQIAQLLAGLIASFPNGKPAQPEVYVELLMEDVASLKPCLMAVENACRSLRREKTFLPAIAEVFAAVKEAQKTAELRRAMVETLTAQRLLPSRACTREADKTRF